MDYLAIIDQYYPQGSKARDILLTHSECVTRKALQIADKHPELKLDRNFIQEAAMLHDIGIVKCDAPGIECFGTEPYIKHGIIGANMLRAAGYPRHARVCERHTGAGIALQNILEQHLPLPHQDFLPETMEEQVICYADKFYSKTHLDRVRTPTEEPRKIRQRGSEEICQMDATVRIIATHPIQHRASHLLSFSFTTTS